VRDALVLSLFALVDGINEHNDKASTGSEDVVCRRLRVFFRNGVVGNLDGSRGNLRDLCLDGIALEVPVNDVRRAQLLQVLGI